MTGRQLSGTTALVTGASRGFGRATAVALAALGADVVGVARSKRQLNELKSELGHRFTPEVADVSDAGVAHRLLSHYRPQTLVLNAGARPVIGPLQEQTWEAFSTNWNTDAYQVFNFVCEVLTDPLEPGSVVVSVSSAAALRGSPLSGSYAGSKATGAVHKCLWGCRSRTANSRTTVRGRPAGDRPVLQPPLVGEPQGEC